MKNSIKRYLELSKFSSQVNRFEDYFLSHPNYPSLYAITDSLDLLGIENIAIKIQREHFFELPTFFLALFKDELVLVEKTATEIYITREHNKRTLSSFDDFFSGWNGIVLVIEESEKKVEESTKYSKHLLLFGVVFILYFISNQKNLSLISVSGFTLTIIGLLVGITILKEKYNSDESVLTSRLCNLSDNTSCSSVLKSNYSLVPNWFDFSDLPILFFGTALVSQLLNGKALFVVGLLSVMSIPLVIYSIYLQKVKIKKWCALCLVTSIILVLLSIIGVFINESFSIKLAIEFTIIGLVVTVSWLIIKYYFISNSSLLKENLELKKFKRNPIMFSSLLKPVANYESIQMFNTIFINKEDTPLDLILIISPSCNHCHTAYKDAVELQKSFADKISITILFNVNPNNQLNNYLDLVFTLLFINKKWPNKVVEALNDWHIKRMDLESWLLKWKQANNDFANEKIELEQQYNWCQENNFNFTPVRLINNNIYPIEYSINELKFFISELEEKLEIV